MSEVPGPVPPYEIELVNNYLNVNGSLLLNAESITPEAVHTILTLGRTAILSEISELFQYSVRKNPDAKQVLPPSINVMRLDVRSRKKSVLTQSGLDNTTRIHSDRAEIKPRYQPYWDAVEASDFVPEVRSDYAAINVGGIWLALRAPEDDSNFAFYGIEIPGRLEADLNGAFYSCINYIYYDLDDEFSIAFAQEARNCQSIDEMVGIFVAYVRRITAEYGFEWKEDVEDYVARLGLLEQTE